MEYHHITQEIAGNITVGDQLAVIFDEDDGVSQSGKYTVAVIAGKGPYELTLVGADGTTTAGHITTVYFE